MTRNKKQNRISSHETKGKNSCFFCKSQKDLWDVLSIGHVCKKDTCQERALELLKQRFPGLSFPTLRKSILERMASAKVLQLLRDKLARLIQSNEPVGPEYFQKISATIDFILIFASRTKHKFRLEVVQICRRQVGKEKAEMIIKSLSALSQVA